MRIALASLGVLVCLGAAAAQEPMAVASIRYAGRYDVASGVFHPASGPTPADGSAEVLYDNTATNGFLTTGSGTIVTHHLMDWGTPEFAGGGATVTELRIGYATNLLAPAPVQLRVRLTSGATGFGVLGSVVADLVLSGLPNSTFGAYEGFLVDVTLAQPLALSSGPLGWSYNSDTTPSSSTGPLMVGPPNAAGVVDAHDRYLEATDAFVGTFDSFAAVDSFVLRLTGHAHGVSTWTSYGTGEGVQIQGEGPGTPGSANVVHVQGTVPGKAAALVAGVTPSDFLDPVTGLQFYAAPWIVQFGPLPTSLVDGSVDFPLQVPAGVPSGQTIHLQAFGADVTGRWPYWSAGLQLSVP